MQRWVKTSRLDALGQVDDTIRAVEKKATTSPALELDKVTFAYDSQPVVSELSLSIKAGSFLGLLGPNGSGKTTLIQLLCGALRAGSGSVKVINRGISDWDRRELARLVAVVPQRFELAFPFTVEQVVLLGRLPHRGSLALDGPDDLLAAEEAMQATGVLHLRRRRMHELSGGEFKRVVVAKALAQKPRILLLDEPAAHLDIRHQVTLYDLIGKIRNKTGVTVVSAMHDLNLAAAYCDVIALLKNGELLCVGGVEEVMTYRNLRDVFEIDIYVGVNELTGHRLFTPMLSGSPEEE
ncbi:MAG: ABC transporter ATP-binding protein [Deltaproteobacteria bacterium]|nr:ABC transporter ATP-binding protein [Deltaproteobacteria bacterium]MBW1870860.1 ABC transporter ATP-binding protein [Deltaproteobacteria bacterium]